MKMFFYSRARNRVPKDFLRRCMEATRGWSFDWAVNEEYAEVILEELGMELSPENRYREICEGDMRDDAVMVAAGGDGTFLDAVHLLRGLPMPVTGINTGRMGFLAQIMLQDIRQALADLVKGRFTTERRTMLSVEGDFSVPPAFPCALNEFTLHRHTADMVEVVTHTDGHLLATIRGDGVIISTPTGSTAYSLSVGGPILTPGCSSFVCSAIAPHNFSIRPLVIPDTSTIEMEVRTRGREVMVSLDNRSFIVGDGARFTIKKSKFHTILAQVQNISFYDTLRDRIMWGLDRRDGIQTNFFS